MFLEQIKFLFIDKKVISYLPIRGIKFGLFFMFGIIISSLGYEQSQVFLHWAFFYILQGVVFLLVESLGFKNRFIYGKVFAGLSFLISLWISVDGINALSFMFILVFLQPSLRNIINDITIYVREKENWPLGVDIASMLLNETGKAVGGLVIAFLSFLIALENQVLPQVLVCISFSVLILSLFIRETAPELISNQENKKEKSTSIGVNGKKLLIISFIHNGLFFGMLNFLSILMLDTLRTSSLEENPMSKLGMILSITIILSLAVNNWVKSKKGLIIDNKNKTGFLWISLFIIALVNILVFISILLQSINYTTPFLSAVLIGIGIGLLQAMGGLYNIGFLQIIDANYVSKEISLKKEIRRKILNLNATICSFSPPIILFIIYFVLSHDVNVLGISLIFAGIVVIMEIWLSIIAFHLGKKIEGNYIPSH